MNARVSEAVEKYNQARIKYDQAARRVEILRGHIRDERDKVSHLRSKMGEMASAAYRTGGMDSLAGLFSGTPKDFLDRAASLNNLSRSRNALLNQYETEVSGLRKQQVLARKALAEQRRIKDEIETRKNKVKSQLEEQKELLERVDPPETTPDVYSTYDGSASGSAEVAVQFAYDQLGDPYVWGGDGPDTWDCSGLTMGAWGAAGVSLPHSSQAQYSSGPQVAREDLQPGDLVFFGSPIHHVGIYVGNDQMINAPNSGEVVQVTSLSEPYYASEYVGAVRP